jgi:hypothetical protein
MASDRDLARAAPATLLARAAPATLLARATAAALLVLAAGACSSGARPAPRPTRAVAVTGRAGGSGPGGGRAARGSSAPACVATPGAVQAATTDGLRHALATARPGATIVLAAGTYHGDFAATSSGTAAAPIVLCGTRAAVLAGASTSHGYTFYLDHASWWRLDGFTVSGGQKGVVADGVAHDTITGLYVHRTGDEAIHLRSFSSDNVVSHNKIRATGLDVAFFGEGIYVGSAHSNWCDYTKCHPDASDGNVIADNNIAGTTAENIDIKEGTTGGSITGNTLNGTGMVPAAATAWVNVKGNGWQVVGNTGTQTAGDGFQVHQVYPGWGTGNVFRRNKAAVPPAGFGVYVQSRRLQTIVACSNVTTGGELSNIGCTGPQVARPGTR